MRFEHLRLRGIGPLHDVDIDFSAIQGRIIAVTGANGEGKTMLLGSLFGAVYRDCPTRGRLTDIATRRDSFIEARVVNGASYTIRQSIDAHTGKSEALILDVDGNPVVASGKVRDADAFVKSHFPAPEVVLASMFQHQQSAGFLGLRASERKGVLLKVLGVERLEQLAERARERHREAKARLTTAEARLVDERARFEDVAQAAAALEAAQAEAVGAGAAADVARQRLAEIEGELALARDAWRAGQERSRRLEEARQRHAAARNRLADLETRAGNNRQLLGRADEIRAAEQRDAELATALADLQTARARYERDLEDATRRRAEHWLRAREAASESLAAQTRVQRAESRLAGRVAIEAAAAAIPGLRAELEAAERALGAAQAEVDRLTDLRQHGSERRIVGLRGGLSAIAGHEGEPVAIAARTLGADDAAAQDAAGAPAALETARRAVPDARSAVEEARSHLAAREQLAARAGDLDAAQRDLEEATVAHGAAALRATQAEEAAGAADADAAGARDLVATTDISIADRNRERAAQAPLVGLGDRLRQAEARLAELEPQVAIARSDAEKVGEEVEQLLVASVADPAEPNEQPLLEARTAVNAAESRLRSAEAAVAVREAADAQARAAAGRRQVLEAEYSSAVEATEDWARLAADLGRDGLQALEIDAAGPELTELVNDLLHFCIGPRWTVSIETSRLSADGKRELEGCEVRVLDTERGRDAAAETLSGGERVIVGEAISLALSMLACRRAGLEGVTLVRDESGAALDPVNARAYLSMLRRAADQIGARHVLFVSHNAELHELADARLVVADGRVEVC